MCWTKCRRNTFKLTSLAFSADIDTGSMGSVQGTLQRDNANFLLGTECFLSVFIPVGSYAAYQFYSEIKTPSYRVKDDANKIRLQII